MDGLEKIYQDFLQKRNDYKLSNTITTTMPTGSGSIISGGSIGMDFTSLYPGVQKRYYKLKVMIRKKKIQRMFQNPS
jgi:hypothetical protein